jgi:hypothetical protein
MPGSSSSCRFVHILPWLIKFQLGLQHRALFKWPHVAQKRLFSSPNTSTMSKSEESTIEVKLFVDTEKRKVLFAESDKEFVGVLTIPLGTIVRLLGKQSKIGCLDEIYKSVEDLSPDLLPNKGVQEDASRTAQRRLRPLRSAQGQRRWQQAMGGLCLKRCKLLRSCRLLV